MHLTLLFLSFCLLTNAQETTITKNEMRLNGDIKSVETTVFKNDYAKGKKRSVKRVCSAKHHFSEQGQLTRTSGFISAWYQPNIPISLDTSEYQIDEVDTNEKVLTATKKHMDTIREYEIRHYTYDQNGLLLTDSSRHGQYIEHDIFSEGPIVNKYLYDDQGNRVYHWFKSSFVFAIWDHWLFEYEYDEHQNWTKMTRFIIQEDPSSPVTDTSDLENITCTPEWSVERVITYY